MSRKQLVAIGILAVILGGSVWFHCQPSTGQAGQRQVASKPTFVLNLTSGISDLHRTTMALDRARQALDDGREVVVFLNVNAPELTKREVLSSHFGDNPPPGEMLQTLMQRGAQIHVCPMCMKALNLDRKELFDGVVITDHERFFTKLTTDTNVFSY